MCYLTFVEGFVKDGDRIVTVLFSWADFITTVFWALFPWS